MEFAQQLFSMLDDEARARLVYKPSKAVKGRLMKRVTPMIESQMTERHRFSDVEFIVGEERTSFFGQKYIFATLSPWLEERLYANGPCTQLELPEVSEEAFRCVYNVAYGQEPPITAMNVLNVLETSIMMETEFLSGECLGLLAQNISGDNVLDIFNAAVEQDILTLTMERRFCKVILKHAKKVIQSPAFLTTSTDLMTKIVACDFLNVDEVELWRRLVLWAKTQAANELESKDAETPMGDEQDFNVGDKVILLNGNVGTISFKGEVGFGPGIWFGIDLRDAVGDTSGTVDDRQYFEASKENGGVFVRLNQIGAAVREQNPEEEVRVPCACGGDLTKSTSAIVGGGTVVQCSSCSKKLGNDETDVFHCERGQVKAHAKGYKICQDCYDKKRETEMKENERMQPVPRDVQYLRQVMPFVRFPIMPLDFFIERVAPLMPRQMSDSVLMASIVPTRQCMFPTQPREDFSSTGRVGLEYSIIAANPQPEKAANIATPDVAAQWSGIKMNESGGSQYFIIDCGARTRLDSMDLKNHYQDGDTIKDCVLFALAADREYDEKDLENDEAWVEQCQFESSKTKAWQRGIGFHTNINARYYKFLVTSVYGGEGNYTCINEIILHGEKLEAGADDDDDDEFEARVISKPYTVIEASHSLEKARKLQTPPAEWSGVKNQDAGKHQWFIFDLGSNEHIAKVDMKHRFQDNDTIRDIELYYLPEGAVLGAAEKQDDGGAWVKGCDLLSRQTNELQEIPVPMDKEIKARFWKFKVMTLYGGGVDCNHYPCMNSFIVFVRQEMWTTGICKAEE